MQNRKKRRTRYQLFFLKIVKTIAVSPSRINEISKGNLGNQNKWRRSFIVHSLIKVPIVINAALWGRGYNGWLFAIIEWGIGVPKYNIEKIPQKKPGTINAEKNFITCFLLYKHQTSIHIAVESMPSGRAKMAKDPPRKAPKQKREVDNAKIHHKTNETNRKDSIPPIEVASKSCFINNNAVARYAIVLEEE